MKTSSQIQADVISVSFNSKKVYEDEIFGRQDNNFSQDNPILIYYYP